jgi:hypothetical protein
VLKHWWASLTHSLTHSLTWCIMLWRCDIYWCCVRLLGLIVCLTFMPHYTTCTHIHYAPPSGSSRPCRSDFKYGLYTPCTPLHAEETVNVTRNVSEWVSEWVSGPHVRIMWVPSVCIRDSQLCRSVIIHHQRNRQIYAFLIVRERKRRGWRFSAVLL